MAYWYILKLDTYYEERTACWKESKLTNGPILGPDQGVPPAPWDLRFSFTPAFEDRESTSAIPGTQVKKPCGNCGGRSECDG